MPGKEVKAGTDVTPSGISGVILSPTGIFLFEIASSGLLLSSPHPAPSRVAANMKLILETSFEYLIVAPSLLP